MKYFYYDYIDLLNGIENLSKQIRKSEWMPDYIVAMARGGAVAGVYLSHELDVPVIIVNLSTRHHWADEIKADAKTPLISKILKEKMNILVLDDIVDTGKTIKILLDKWKVKSYNNEQVKIASLIYNNSQAIHELDHLNGIVHINRASLIHKEQAFKQQKAFNKINKKLAIA
jgi:xanthine phosphoribosyltransferase